VSSVGNRSSPSTYFFASPPLLLHQHQQTCCRASLLPAGPYRKKNIHFRIEQHRSTFVKRKKEKSMMRVESGTNLRDLPASSASATDPDSLRGRKRDRSMTRSNVKQMRPDESSTLRGRSPRRATSPFDHTSRTATPSLLSPTRHLLLHHHIQKARREHCPSRVAASVGQAQLDPRRPRSRSRGRGTYRAQRQDTEGHRSTDLLSGLRNEVRIDDTEAMHKS
jgi:hypothetical protein